MTQAKKYLDRAAILGARDPAAEFDMPEWGGTLRLRRLTLGDTLRLQEAPAADYAALLIAACVVDDDGRPIFGPEDVDAIKEKPMAEINRLVARLGELNGLGAKAEKAIAGNSGASPDAS